MTHEQEVYHPKILLVNRCAVVNDEGKVLFIQRAVNDRHSAGQWELPGGKLDEGEDISYALEREVLQETGLNIIVVNRMVHAYGRVLNTGPYAGYSYVQLTGIGRVIAGNLRLSFEHDAAEWCHADEARRLNLTHETAQALSVLDHITHSVGP